MKKLILAGVLAFSVVYANEANMELEHAIKSSSGVESVAGNMSKMKAAGKCGADQKMTSNKFKPTKKGKSDLELEHAIKSSTGIDSVAGNMSKMKAAGKCGSN